MWQEILGYLGPEYFLSLPYAADVFIKRVRTDDGVVRYRASYWSQDFARPFVDDRLFVLSESGLSRAKKRAIEFARKLFEANMKALEDADIDDDNHAAE